MQSLWVAPPLKKKVRTGKDRTHDGGDGHRKLQPTRHSIIGVDLDESRLIDRPGVMTIGRLGFDLLECRFPFWAARAYPRP